MERMENGLFRLENGYECKTTFIDDFAIAVKFGIDGVKDTYKRAFREWKDNHVFLTELVIALNLWLWKTWRMGNVELSKMFDTLWREADAYAIKHLKGDELTYFYDATN